MDLTADRATADTRPRASERYAIGLLFAIYTSSFVDRTRTLSLFDKRAPG